MRKEYYDDREEHPEEVSMAIASQCRQFRQRGGIASFNMTDYRSCENCSHMTPENRCALQMEDRFTDIM